MKKIKDVLKQEIEEVRQAKAEKVAKESEGSISFKSEEQFNKYVDAKVQEAKATEEAKKAAEEVKKALQENENF
ncbi:hypothetical protein [Niallia sp. MER TA 168]|uniref:hypothetical protein n=1 Tax=Niallia sp. MER TA 168 TaxID=2939568 RepID=UPI0020408E4C|nr:hypothetical protein [Niallia sp. MER TA 168]MCM3363177.1 hypothetical protein [Niallia sp. MER TA 168]